VAEVIHEETGAKVLALYNLETLNEKEMAKGHDYFSIMERNLNALKIALGEKEQ
jgi:zinc transport system substrate-binding protein